MLEIYGKSVRRQEGKVGILLLRMSIRILERLEHFLEQQQNY